MTSPVGFIGNYINSPDFCHFRGGQTKFQVFFTPSLILNNPISLALSSKFGYDNFIAKVLLILKNILCKIVLVKVIHGFGKRRQMMLLQNYLFFTNPWLNADGYQAPGNGCSVSILICLMSHIQLYGRSGVQLTFFREHRRFECT